MCRWAPVNEQLGQGRQHIFVAELAGDHQRQALAAGLVDDREDAELTPVVRPRLDKVIRPDMPRILRSQPNTRAIVQPQPTAFWLTLGHLQPFAPPDPLHPFVV